MKKQISNSILAFIAGAVCSVLGGILFKRLRAKPSIKRGLEGLIGNTPVVFLKSLSDLTGC